MNSAMGKFYRRGLERLNLRADETATLGKGGKNDAVIIGNGGPILTDQALPRPEDRNFDAVSNKADRGAGERELNRVGRKATLRNN